VHILTKVFVVFAAVLALVLAALTMTYSVNADRVEADHRNALARAAEAAAARDAATSQFSEMQNRLARQVDQLSTDNANLRSQIRDLLTENSRLLADKRKAEEDAQSTKNQIGDFVESIKAQASRIESYRAEVTALRTSELRLRRETLSLEDRLNDLESQRQVYEQTTRALQEQLVATQRALQSAQQGTLTAGGRADQPYEATGALITGRVTKVRKDPSTGQTLVELNVGTNDRVAENMKLYVGRGRDTFVANLVVVTTDLNNSVARVDLLAGDAVREGDLVLSRLY